MSTVAIPSEQQIKKIAFKQIVMATDFSASSTQALGYAVAIARRYGGNISLVHAIPPEPLDSIPRDPLPDELNRAQFEAKEKIRRLEEATSFREIPHQAAIITGDAGDVISSTVQREHADLLVLGTHGRGALKKVMLGSIAEQALRVASCPALTVGAHVPEAKNNAACFRSILFATDFGPSSTRAFPLALALAEDCGAKLVLLHMVPPISVADIGAGGYGPAAYRQEDLTAWHEQVRKESLRKLKALIPADAKLRTPPAFIVQTNFLPDGILNTAELHESDLIVMGATATHSPRVAAHIPWSVVSSVVSAAHCPVLTVST
jgi:nucleotide-binding universal stress UspA family protein